MCKVEEKKEKDVCYGLERQVEEQEGRGKEVRRRRERYRRKQISVGEKGQERKEQERTGEEEKEWRGQEGTWERGQEIGREMQLKKVFRVGNGM